MAGPSPSVESVEPPANVSCGDSNSMAGQYSTVREQVHEAFVGCVRLACALYLDIE